MATKADAKEAAATEEAASEATEDKEPKIKPKPEGYVSPYAFADDLAVHLGQDKGSIRPQTIYALVRNRPKGAGGEGDEFPVEENVDGKYMIHVETALDWWDRRAAAKAEKKAAKAKEEAAKDKEAAAAE